MISEEDLAVEKAYQAALDYLYSFINLEAKTLERYHASKMDPERPRTLLAALGDPQHQFASIHIAGTKGKGSVAAMCAASLRAAGLRVGLYTSPHLRDFRERIRVLTPGDADGKISKQAFVAGTEKIKAYDERFPQITWFEIVTAIAFCTFAEQNVDIAVIEVGLGGRLDATNVLQPLVSVITSLSLDHTNLLGDTLAEIAFEKGGIIKPGIPVVSAPQQEEALATLLAIASGRNCTFELVGRDWLYEGQNHWLNLVRSAHEAFVPSGSDFEVALAGLHQLENATVAVAALYPVQERFPQMTMQALRVGLAEVQWDGRLQLVFEEAGYPTLLVDAAHNPHSASKLAAALRDYYQYDRLWLIFGAPQDKAIGQVMDELFPLADEIIVSSADHPRAASPESLAALANEQGFFARTAETPADALRIAFANAGESDLICVTGSIIFAGDLLNQWDVLQSELLKSSSRS